MNDENGHINHTLVKAPYIRLIEELHSENFDVVKLWDIRLTQPNADFIEIEAIHSLEHCFLFLLPNLLEGYINIHPYGCRTGFELVTIGDKSKADIIESFRGCLMEIGNLTEVPWANIRECGNYREHSIEKAKSRADEMLKYYDEWSVVFDEPAD